MASKQKTFNDQPANDNDNDYETPENLPTSSKRPAGDNPEAYGKIKRHGQVTITYVLNPEQGKGDADAEGAIAAAIEKNSTNVFDAIIEENSNDSHITTEEDATTDVVAENQPNSTEDSPFQSLREEWLLPTDVISPIAELPTVPVSPFVDVVTVDEKEPPSSSDIYLTIAKELNEGVDPMQTWPYAMDAFKYLREREKKFIIKDYVSYQPEVDPWNRRLLISWMVNVHQSLGTYRESLFLSVKIVDLYLSRYEMKENMLELLGAAAMYIASKFELKKALPMYRLLKPCHCAYSRADLVDMEWRTLCGIGFDLGIPIAYRFLRRYSRGAELPEFLWTLGSYILELAMLEYTTIRYSDSQMAAAALFMAMRMCGDPRRLTDHTWEPKLVHYSGYELPDFARLVPMLNALLFRRERETDKAVRDLYSTPLLFRVSTVPPLTNEELFSDNPDLYDVTKW